VPEPTTTTMIALNTALRLIRETQATAGSFGYHICLGGGVLNRGFSEKDLDLYFLPLIEQPQDPTRLLESLEIGWGPSDPAFSGGAAQGPYLHKRRYDILEGRVEVFIMGWAPNV
jgi:hypothetical protein